MQLTLCFVNELYDVDWISKNTFAHAWLWIGLMQSKSNSQSEWANFDKEKNCWKIDIKFETKGFSKFMVNLLIKSVTWTEQDNQPEREEVERLRKDLEEIKLVEEGEASMDGKNKWLKLYPNPEVTLSERSKGQHLSYAEKLHIMCMHRYQGWPKDEIWTLYRISASTFRKIQEKFKFGILPKFSEWRRTPSKLLHSRLLKEQIGIFVDKAQSQVTVKDVQLYLQKSIGVQIPSHIVTIILKKKLNYSWKRISQRVVDLDLDRIKLLKILYSVKFTKCISHLSLLVNVDESSFSKGTQNCYSWAQRGEEKTVKGIIFKGSVSVISWITSDGNAYTEVVEGTLTGQKFIEYTDRFIAYLKRINSIDVDRIGIIFDNCSIHRSMVVNTHLINHKMTQILIPPYCPEFAPIELFFSLVKKRILKKHRNEGLDLKKESWRNKILQEFNKVDWECIRNLWKPMFHKIKDSIGELVTII